MESFSAWLWYTLGLSTLVELKLEIDARSSTWVGCLESSWCKWFAGLCCGPEAAASVLKLVQSLLLCSPLLLLAWVVPSLFLLVLLVLLLVGGVPPASLGTVPFLPADVAPLFSFWKLLLPLAFVGWRLGRESFSFSFGLFAFSFAFLFFSFASFVKLLLVVRVWLLAFPFALSFLLVSPSFVPDTVQA